MFNEFKEKYLGQTVDIDGAFAGQCVDLFNAWNRDYNGCYINCQPTGYARSIAENKANNGILNYFNETAINNMVEGTVVVYGKCNFAPEGHVCFFIKDNGNGTYQALQQNAGGRQYVTIDNNPYDGIIGAFIPNQIIEERQKIAEEQARKQAENQSINIEDLANRVIAGEFGNGEERRNALGSNYDIVQARVNEILNGQSSTNIEELAQAVIRGEYGNGEERRDKLGNLYDQVQARVNELMK